MLQFINTMILVLLLGFIHRTSSEAEYYVKGGILKPLSYLEYNFTKISSDIFPNNLEVKFVMWHTIGTLIYSMDKNGNQFILEVSHMGDIPHMTIKIRKRERDLNFKRLCGCKGYCKEENVTLLVNIKGTKLSISCNGNNESHLEIPNKKDVVPDWPVPPFPNSPHNQAILWALNVPEKYGGDSDPYQIGCCLFYVRYNNEVINMTVYGSGIKNKCPRSCTLYPCNSREICNEKYTDTGQRNCTKIISGPVASITFKSVFPEENLKVTWTAPSTPNGVITHYLVYVISTADNTTVECVILKCNDCEDVTNADLPSAASSCPANIQNTKGLSTLSTVFNDSDKIKPYTNYTVNVVPRNGHGWGTSKSETKKTSQYKPSNAATLNNLSLIISIPIVITVIVVCVIVIYCNKRKRKSNVTKNDLNKENVRLISMPCNPNNPNLIGFGIKDADIKGIDESINEHLNKDKLC